MAFKYICILLLVSVVLLLAQAKNIKKGKSKQNGKYGTEFQNENMMLNNHV